MAILILGVASLDDGAAIFDLALVLHDPAFVHKIHTFGTLSLRYVQGS